MLIQNPTRMGSTRGKIDLFGKNVPSNVLKWGWGPFARHPLSRRPLLVGVGPCVPGNRYSNALVWRPLFGGAWAPVVRVRPGVGKDVSGQPLFQRSWPMAPWWGRFELGNRYSNALVQWRLGGCFDVSGQPLFQRSWPMAHFTPSSNVPQWFHSIT